MLLLSKLSNALKSLSQLPFPSANLKQVTTSNRNATESPNFVEEVRNNTYYLGAPSLRDEVEWRKIRWEDVLVTRASAEAADAVRKESLTLTVHDAETAEARAESLLEPACLTMVALLTPHKFSMDADGNWKGPTTHTKDFAKVKLSARAVAPPPQLDAAPFAADFADVLGNLEFLANAVPVVGTMALKKGALDSSEEKPAFQYIKIRHVLFEKKRSDEADETQTSTEFPIEQWPVRSLQAREDLAKMVPTHQVCRIPAYDVNGGLIHPSDYRRKLMGAVVYITFTLKHWVFQSSSSKEPKDPTAACSQVNCAARSASASSKEGVDVYAADIAHMRVLVPPPATPPIKRQRNPPQMDSGSPSKKARRG